MEKTHVIDGVTYVEVDRKAEVGEKVLVIGGAVDEINIGKVYNVTNEYERFVHTDGEYDDGSTLNLWSHEYRVLEPASPDVEVVPPSVLDLLASLSRKIVSLEQQLRDTQGNVEKLSQELANARHRIRKHEDRFAAVEDKVEMVLDDICALDERSQVLNAINKYYAEGSR